MSAASDQTPPISQLPTDHPGDHPTPEEIFGRLNCFVAPRCGAAPLMVSPSPVNTHKAVKRAVR